MSANPDTLTAELRRLVVDAELRRELGRQGPGYVRRYHGLEAAGRQMDAVWRRAWDAS